MVGCSVGCSVGCCVGRMASIRLTRLKRRGCMWRGRNKIAFSIPWSCTTVWRVREPGVTKGLLASPVTVRAEKQHGGAPLRGLFQHGCCGRRV